MTPLAIARGVGIADRLRPADLRIEPAQLVAVIGPNGGGKTSLLRAMARTEGALGTVEIEDQDLDLASEGLRRRLVAFMPASRDAPWPIRVRDMVELGLGRPDGVRKAELIAGLELDPLADRAVNRLSTGERARVMLARSIAGRARLLLLDEPLSNLDPYWVLRSLHLIRAELTANQSSALVSLHDLSLLGRFDRAVLVNDGSVIADGKAADIVEARAFSDAFRIEADGAAWAIRKTEGPRSSP